MKEKLKSNSGKEKLPKQKKEKSKSSTQEIFPESVRLDYFRQPDNAKSNFLKILLDLLVVLFLVMYGLILAFTIESKNNYGVPTFAGTSYYQFDEIPSELNTTSSNNMAVFDTKKQFSIGDVVGYKTFNAAENKINVEVGKVKAITNDNVEFTNGKSISKAVVFGVLKQTKPASLLYKMMTDQNTFIYWCVFPVIVFLIISISCYFVLYPRKVKISFFEEMFNGQNDNALTSSLNTAPAVATPAQVIEQDDNITEYTVDEDEEPIAGSEFETFYTSTKSKNGELYALVKKYQTAVDELQEFGATDMDIIRMNMVGNSEFNALLTSTHREKPMTLEEIIAYISSFDDVYCIKKRGAINWTYKYKSKTVMIVRGNNSGYKVSFKVYPDAAEKLNRVYCALEDSSFPSGPYWYMFNDLKNLSAPVAKWLIKESYIISMFQERKAELLRIDEKSAMDLGVDMSEIKAQIDSGVNILPYDKFAVVAHKIDKNKLELTTLLDSQIPGLFTDDYVKEVFAIVNGRDDLAISFLFAKNASEQLVNALCMEIENACSNAGSSQEQNDIMPQIAMHKESAPVKMVKKSTTTTKRR